MISHAKRLVVPLIVLGMLGIAAAADATSWKVVKEKSSPATLQLASVNASIAHAQRIAVEFVGGTGFAIWACVNGRVRSENPKDWPRDWTKDYGSGLYELSHVRGMKKCSVTGLVTGSGSGQLEVEILTAK